MIINQYGFKAIYEEVAKELFIFNDKGRMISHQSNFVGDEHDIIEEIFITQLPEDRARLYGLREDERDD